MYRVKLVCPAAGYELELIIAKIRAVQEEASAYLVVQFASIHFIEKISLVTQQAVKRDRRASQRHQDPLMSLPSSLLVLVYKCKCIRM